MIQATIQPNESQAPRADGLRHLLLRVLREFDRRDLIFCVIRGGDDVDDLVADGEVDLLAREEQLSQFGQTLAQLGFVWLERWGHAPHSFFVAYDEVSDQWLKLDIVTEVAYGRPAHALRTDLADNCLSHRHKPNAVWLPSPEDELVTLLLHCIVDKGNFPQHWRQRIRELHGQVTDEGYVSELLMANWSNSMGWTKLSRLIDGQRWDRLLSEEPMIVGRLTDRDRLGTVGRMLRDRLLRKAQKLVRFIRPESISVAILAPDGAGKSTLAETLRQRFYFPVEQIYMGLYQKGQRTAKRSHVPGLGLVDKLLTQWCRYLTGQYHRARGRFVIFDRYTYDAFLPSRKKLGRVSRFRRWLLGNACPAPDLTVVLDAPGELLYARKLEHTPELLEWQRQGYLALERRVPRLVLVDATRDADAVRREVTARMWRGYAERQIESLQN